MPILSFRLIGKRGLGLGVALGVGIAREEHMARTMRALSVRCTAVRAPILILGFGMGGVLATASRSGAPATKMLGRAPASQVSAPVRLMPDSQSDILDVDVYLLTVAGGRHVVYRQGRVKGRSFSLSAFWFVDADARTFRAISIASESTTVDRVLAALQERGVTADREDVAEIVQKRTAARAVRATELADTMVRRAERIKRLPAVDQGLVFQQPDGSPSDTPEVAHEELRGCPGVAFMETMAYDPVAIEVAAMTFAMSWDDEFNEDSPNVGCRDKDAAGYWWPAKTEWYTDTCDTGGSPSGDNIGFDLYGVGEFHNTDWGDEQESTNVWMQSGVQYQGGLYWYDWYFDWGEDSWLIWHSSDVDVMNFCL